MEKIITNMEVYSNHNLSAVKMFYEKWVKENPTESKNVSFTDWLDMKYIQPKKFKWVCSSVDGYFEDSYIDNHETFKTQEEAYDSMKDNAISRVCFYYNDVIEDCCPFDSATSKLTETPDDMGVHCNIEFHPHKIILDRNGCVYEYVIENIGD